MFLKFHQLKMAYLVSEEIPICKIHGNKLNIHPLTHIKKDF